MRLFSEKQCLTFSKSTFLNAGSHCTNKTMANSVWGKRSQNSVGQTSFKTYTTLKDFHENLLTGRVKSVSLVSGKMMQIEMDNDRSIEGGNRDINNN